MATFIPWGDPQERGVASVADNQLPPPTPTSDLKLGSIGEPSFFDQAAASLSLNNVPLTVARDLYYDATAGDLPNEFDASYNPYKWLKDNQSPEVLDRLKDEIAAGLFDNSFTPRMTQAKVGTLLSEKRLIETQGANFWSGLLGMGVGGALDPTTYLVPGGEYWTTGSTAIRLGKSLLHTAATVGPQEAILHSTEDLRTWEQSAMNIGTALGTGLLFGGVGVFSRGLMKDHPLNAENVNNPLLPDNLSKQGLVARVPGEEAEDNISWTPATSTVGAAENVEGPRKLGGSTAAGRTFFGVTPSGRALEYESPATRDILVNLQDLGGVLTDTNRAGKATGKSAEDLFRDNQALWADTALQHGESLITQTGKDLGALGARGLDPADFNLTAQRILTDTFTGADRAHLETNYGQAGAQKIVDNATAYAEAIHGINSDVEKKLVDIGAVRNDAKIKALQAQIDANTAARTSELAEPGADQAAIRERYSNENLRAQLNAERSKPAALGRAYGHAQLWEPAQIGSRPAEYREYLTRVLADRPDEGWLMDAHGMTGDQFAALRNTDPAKAQAILTEWTGDAHYHRLTRLEHALEGAQDRAKQANLDWNDALRRAGLARKGEANAKLTEARKFRDRLAAAREASRNATIAAESERQSLIAGVAAARQKTLDRALEFTPGGIRSPEPTPTIDLAKAEARAVELARIAQRERARTARLDARLQDLDAAHSAAQGALDTAAAVRQALTEALTEARAAKNLSGKNLREVKRALLRETKRTPLDETIDEITRHLSLKDEIPTSALEATLTEGGSMKARRLVLTKDQKLEAYQQGWLRDDLPNVLRRTYNSLAAHVGIREGLGIGEGGKFDSWGAVERAIENDYARLRTAQPGRDANLAAEQKRAIGDLHLLRDRLLGRTDPGVDRDGWIHWLSAKTRQANFLRYGGTFLVSSLTDLATVALNHRLIPMLRQHGAEAWQIAKQHNHSPTQLRSFLNTVETAQHAAMMSASRVGDEDLFRSLGLGVPGSRTRTVTSRIDKGLLGLSNFISTYSGLPLWSRFWKIASGLDRAYSLRDMVSKYGNLSELERISAVMNRRFTRDCGFAIL